MVISMPLGVLKITLQKKVITHSDSTQIVVRENVFFVFMVPFETKVAQTPPKSDQFVFNMQTGICHPYGAT